MTSVTITLPMPHKHLSPNSRCHWAQKANAKRNQREAARHFILSGILEAELNPLDPWRTADVSIIVTAPDKRRRDKDNILASLKAAFDGAQDAGLVADDSGLTYLPINIVTGTKATAGVRITFTKTS